ncbi:MAG: oligosaccharide flippase family protein [Muribaculaceae bacterium]|nr:oligosaccharide flippase family protein [Muribaculaceae bacterium]
MIIPLVTLPYLIKTIGMDYYGVYSIVYVLIQYVILICAYGFNFSTTKQISLNRNDINQVNKIVNATILSRLLLAFSSFLIVFLFTWIYYPKDYSIMLLYGSGMVIGDVINPTWLFQGMEKMKFMTVINFISKVVFTLAVFVFIKDDHAYIYITLLNSLGFLTAGIISYVFAYKYFNLKIFISTVSDIKEQFGNGWFIFLSTLSMNLYRNANIFILSLFVSPALIGIYSAAEKVIKAIQAINSPIANALFPHISVEIKKDKTHNIAKIWRLCLIIGFFLLIVSCVTFFIAPLLNKLLLDDTVGAVSLINIMIPVIFFGGLNYILGIVGLINLDAQRAFFHYVMISGVISIVFLISSVNWIGIASAAYAMTISEVVLFLFCSIKLIRFKNINI